MRYIVIVDLQYFSTLSYTRHDFRKKKVIQYKMCVLVFVQILRETFLILRRIERDMIKNAYWSNRYSCQILMKLEFLLPDFRKILKNQF